MGKLDDSTKLYLQDNYVFADVCNFFLFDGKPVIDPNQLHEMDTTAVSIIPYTNRKNQGKVDSVQKYRDVLKSVVVKQDSEAAYVLMGIENQSDIHYAMPVRNMVYDAMQYEKQVSKKISKHRARQKQKEEKASSKEEFLSGFWKVDKILPVITLVIYFGADPWDGPRSLSEMFAVTDTRILKYVQDYKIWLIEPAALSEDDLKKFTTDLGAVLGIIKYSKDAEQLQTFVRDDLSVTGDAACVIQDATNIKLNAKAGKEKIIVCKAIQDIMDKSRQEGRAEGEQKQAMLTVLRMYAKGKSLDEIADDVGFDVETVKSWILAGNK